MPDTEQESDWSATGIADIALIKRLLPHRYPFLLIDEVRDIRPHKSALGIKNVTVNEPFFPGHFPSKPVMPGVLIIEAMAQTAAVLVGLTLGFQDKNALVYFMGIDKARFRRMAVPGDRLEMEVTVLRGSSKFWKCSAVARVSGEIAAEAELMAMLDLGGDG